MKGSGRWGISFGMLFAVCLHLDCSSDYVSQNLQLAFATRGNAFWKNREPKMKGVLRATYHKRNRPYIDSLTEGRAKGVDKAGPHFICFWPYNTTTCLPSLLVFISDLLPRRTIRHSFVRRMATPPSLSGVPYGRKSGWFFSRLFPYK